MTRPSGARWSSVSRTSASHWRSVTSNTEPRRLEATSSGPNTRKLVGLAVTTSRRNEPRTRVASVKVVPGLGHRHPVLAEIGQHQVPQEPAPVGMGVGAHATMALGRQGGQFRRPGHRFRRKAPRAGSCATTTPAPPGGRGWSGPRPGVPDGNARCPQWAARRQTWGRSSLWANAARSWASGAFRPRLVRGRPAVWRSPVRSPCPGWPPSAGASRPGRRPRPSAPRGRSPPAKR